MKTYSTKLFHVLLICIIAFTVVEIPTGFFKAKMTLLYTIDNSLTINFHVFPNNFLQYCADGSSFLLDVSLVDSENNPVPYSLVGIQLHNFSGTIEPKHPITNKEGRVIIRIRPEFVPINTSGEINTPSNISVSVSLYAKKSKTSVWNGILTYPPVLLIHGFQDTSQSLVPMKNYLESKGFRVFLMDYDSNGNIETMVDTLDETISTMKKNLESAGIYMNKVDIVAHSLGGLVTRYYTTQRTYIKKENIQKIIFINVPHHGTPWADAGAELIGCPFLKNLHPTSELFTVFFPDAINKGLNHQIQTANIALDNDEVVPLPGTTLAFWNIDTKIYRIGSEMPDLESLTNNPLDGETLHRQLLFYTPLFDEITGYLTNKLPYPSKK